MSFPCGGKVGAKLCSTVVPSGATSARNSPPRRSLKLVCDSPAGPSGNFPEANTISRSPGANTRAGNAHFVRSLGSSLRKYPARSTAAPVGLKISIQSSKSPSPSCRPVSLSAMNSEITGWVATIATDTVSSDISDPNGLLAVSTYVVVSAGETATDPLPPEVCPETSPGAGLIDHAVANSVSHESVTSSPALIVERSAPNSAISGAGLTVTVSASVVGPSPLVAVKV